MHKNARNIVFRMALHYNYDERVIALWSIDQIFRNSDEWGRSPTFFSKVHLAGFSLTFYMDNC